MPPRIALLLLLVFASSSLLAQDKPPAAPTEFPVPANALAVVQVRGPGLLPNRLEKLLLALDPIQAPGWAELFRGPWNEMVRGRDVAVLPDDARIFLVVHDVNLAAQQVKFSMVLPFPNYATFRNKFLRPGERKSLQSRGEKIDEFEFHDQIAFAVDLTRLGFVAITTDWKTAESLAGKFKPLTTAHLGPQCSEVFQGSELAAFVHLKALHEQNGIALKAYRLLAVGFLQQGAIPGLPKLDPRQLAILRQIVDGVFQVLEEGNGLALGVDLREKAVTLRVELNATPKSDLGKLFSAHEPARLESIEQLSSGATVMTASSWGENVSRRLHRLHPEYDAPPEQEKAKAAIEKFQALSGKANWFSAFNGSSSSFRFSLGSDPAAITAAHQKVLRTLELGGSFRNLPLKELPVLKTDEVQHGGFLLSRAVLRVDYEVATETILDSTLRDAATESMKRLVADKTNLWFGHDEKRYVEIVAKGWDEARGVLDDFREGKRPLGKDPAFVELRKHLPSEASQLAIVDVRTGSTNFAEFAKAVLTALPAVPGVEIPEFANAPAGNPAYVGSAVVFRPTGFGMTAIIPHESARVAVGVFLPAPKKKP